MATESICNIENCDKAPAKGRRGMCLAHYKRFWRYGDATTQKKITNGEAQRYYREVVATYDGTDCLIWPYAKYPSGYGHLVYEGRDATVSRLVCEEEHGQPPTPDHEAAHGCGNGSGGCVAKRHLRWATPAENAEDKIAHGTVTRGERHGGAKLTEADVISIRALRGKMLQRDIADLFGVSKAAVGLIQRGDRWGCLDAA